MFELWRAESRCTALAIHRRPVLDHQFCGNDAKSMIENLREHGAERLRGGQTGIGVPLPGGARVAQAYPAVCFTFNILLIGSSASRWMSSEPYPLKHEIERGCRIEESLTEAS